MIMMTRVNAGIRNPVAVCPERRSFLRTIAASAVLPLAEALSGCNDQKSEPPVLRTVPEGGSIPVGSHFFVVRKIRQRDELKTINMEVREGSEEGPVLYFTSMLAPGDARFRFRNFSYDVFVKDAIPGRGGSAQMMVVKNPPPDDRVLPSVYPSISDIFLPGIVAGIVMGIGALLSRDLKNERKKLTVEGMRRPGRL